jgi:hypothetical protein
MMGGLRVCLAEGGDRKRAFVKAVMEIRVPKTELNSWLLKELPVPEAMPFCPISLAKLISPSTPFVNCFFMMI